VQRLLARAVLFLCVSTTVQAATKPPSREAAAVRVAVVISADAEWQAVRGVLPGDPLEISPYGEWVFHEFATKAGPRRVVLIHGGWGKIAAAGSAQYIIDRWKPELIVNIGSCGGFRGAAEKGDVVLVDKTVVYDIVEQMGDAAEAIADYTTSIDLAWVGSELPPGVRRGPIVSADRDILTGDVARLQKDYGATVGDWESGAIAWVAKRNGTKVLILRGVSDLVSGEGDEFYGDEAAYEAGMRVVMKRLLDDMPFWLGRFEGR
jgi:adenosylhomocysteine nucleosidase